MKLRITIAMLAFTLLPTLALASSRTTGGRMRPQLFHDRTPKAHIHTTKARLGR